jgi:hypothetical protein
LSNGWVGTCVAHGDCPNSCTCTHGYLLFDDLKCAAIAETAAAAGASGAEANHGAGSASSPAGDANKEESEAEGGVVTANSVGQQGSTPNSGAGARTSSTPAQAQEQPTVQEQEQQKKEGGIGSVVVGSVAGCAALLALLVGLAAAKRFNKRGAKGHQKFTKKSSSLVTDSSSGSFDRSADGGGGPSGFGPPLQRANMALSGGIGIGIGRVLGGGGGGHAKLDEDHLSDSMPKNGEQVDVETGVAAPVESVDSDTRDSSMFTSQHRTPTNQQASKAATAYV